MYMCKVNSKTFHYPSSGLKECCILSGTVSTEFNRAGTFEFQIPPNNKCYLDGEFKKLTSEVEVFWDGDRIFRGRILDSNRSYLGQIKYKCEGWMSVLNDSIVVPGTLSGVSGDEENGITATPATMFTALITSHNSQVEAIKQLVVSISGFNTTAVKFPWPSYEKTLDYIQTNLLSNEEVGGRMYVESNTIYLKEDIEINREDAFQDIVQGRNLLDLTETIDAAEVYTVIYPVGKDDIKVSGASAASGYPIVGNTIECTAAIGIFGRIIHYESFSDAESAQALYNRAKLALQGTVDVIPSIDVSALDLSLVNKSQARLKVGTFVKVTSPLYGIDIPYMCTASSVDICNPANTKYTLGRNPDTLTTKQLALSRNINQTTLKYGSELSTKSITAHAYPANNPYVTINDISFYRSNKTVYISFRVTYLRDGSTSSPEILSFSSAYAPVQTATGTAYDETSGSTHTLKATTINNTGFIQVFPWEGAEEGHVVSGTLTWMMR